MSRIPSFRKFPLTVAGLPATVPNWQRHLLLLGEPQYTQREVLRQLDVQVSNGFGCFWVDTSETAENLSALRALAAAHGREADLVILDFNAEDCPSVNLLQAPATTPEDFDCEYAAIYLGKAFLPTLMEPAFSVGDVDDSLRNQVFQILCATVTVLLKQGQHITLEAVYKLLTDREAREAALDAAMDESAHAAFLRASLVLEYMRDREFSDCHPELGATLEQLTANFKALLDGPYGKIVSGADVGCLGTLAAANKLIYLAVPADAVAIRALLQFQYRAAIEERNRGVCKQDRLLLILGDSEKDLSLLVARLACQARAFGVSLVYQMYDLPEQVYQAFRSREEGQCVSLGNDRLALLLSNTQTWLVCDEAAAYAEFPYERPSDLEFELGESGAPF